jgi:hypothetical protein
VQVVSVLASSKKVATTHIKTHPDFLYLVIARFFCQHTAATGDYFYLFGLAGCQPDAVVDLAQAASPTRTISKRRSLSTKADNPRSITSGNDSASALTNGQRLSFTGNRFGRFRGFK